MRSSIASVVDKIARRAAAVDRYRVLRDIDEERQRRALASTAAFVDDQLSHARGIRGVDQRGARHAARDGKFKVLDLALDLAPPEGLILEFGVFKGETLRKIAARRSPAHGFDSFAGLPEDWRSGFGKGRFATAPPDVQGAELHVGWFEETLPPFLEQYEGSVAFAHIDADLYSSTVTILKHLAPRLVAGSVLLFDEYFNHPGWQAGEHQAFVEFIESNGHAFEYIAYNVMHEQVLVRLTK